MPATKNGRPVRNSRVTKSDRLAHGERVSMSPVEFIRNLRSGLYARNLTSERAALLREFDTTTIDIDKKCRYPENPGIADYQKAYDRHDIAARCIRLYPTETWKMPPEVYETEDMNKETEFEKTLDALDEEFHLFSRLHEVDKLSGIGRFGVLLIGIDDGRDLDQPVQGINEQGDRDGDKTHKLTFLRAFSESSVTVKELETNMRNKRYGQPKTYEIKFLDPKDGLSVVDGVQNTTLIVHWSRVLHVVDNREGSDVFGTPRLQQLFNRIFDVRKVMGGSGEGFWRGGFPGISAETHPQIENPDINIEATREEIQNYMEGFQRALILEGMTAKSLAVQVGDPTPHFLINLQAICIAMDVPMRVFMGTEEGKLASGQDMRLWNSRVMGRQVLYINPFILKPFLNRLTLMGILPKPSNIIIKWPDLNAPTDNDKATHAQKITEALVKYVVSGASQLMSPRDYLVTVLGYEVEVVDRILKAAGDYISLPTASDMLTPPEEMGGESKQPGKSEGAGRE